MASTVIEKIATQYSIGLDSGEVARQGQIVRVRPKHVMTHDNTGAVIPKFLGIFDGTGILPRIADPRQPVFAIDHDIQNNEPANLEKYARIERFAGEYAIDFYPAGSGISHQMMIEEGYVTPGSMVVGSDSHSNMYGGLAALGTPVVRTDAACLWATGTTWWQVPKVARCTLTGQLQPGVAGKDVIIALCGLFNQDEVLNHAVEFAGDGVATLSIDQRLTIANMTTEWGALAGLFPFDEVLRDYLISQAAAFQELENRPGERRAGSLGGYTTRDIERWWDTRLHPDPDASYAIDLWLDLSTVIPHVAGPNEVKTITSLPDIESERVAIQKAYLLSCTNARLEDLAAAAQVVKGKKVAAGVKFYIAAASARIQKIAEETGLWADLVDAGAIPLPTGCGPCIGLGRGTTEDGETAISATNRNFKGRMGSRESQVYLGSPAVVAASAVAGFICAPMPYERMRILHGKSVRINQVDEKEKEVLELDLYDGSIGLIDGFPAKIAGRLLYLPKDNMNTDGIYAGKWTYQDNITPDQMKGVTFENYDTQFHAIYCHGDILISGRNFGTGSSREQAATALKYQGVPCILAASFSETYRRNAFNNGFLCLECPGLVDYLAARYSGRKEKTIVGPNIEIDFQASTVRLGDNLFTFPPLSAVAQELIVAGGAEAIARVALANQ
ncbi:MAG: homoaconitase [Pirellulales bacterium]|nr:homoaconitase [Pirellulales bacterium]